MGCVCVSVHACECVREKVCVQLEQYDVIRVSSPQQFPVLGHTSLCLQTGFPLPPLRTLPNANLCREGKPLCPMPNDGRHSARPGPLSVRKFALVQSSLWLCLTLVTVSIPGNWFFYIRKPSSSRQIIGSVSVPLYEYSHGCIVIAWSFSVFLFSHAAARRLPHRRVPVQNGRSVYSHAMALWWRHRLHGPQRWEELRGRHTHVWPCRQVRLQGLGLVQAWPFWMYHTRVGNCNSGLSRHKSKQHSLKTQYQRYCHFSLSVLAWTPFTCYCTPKNDCTFTVFSYRK